jgi:hypothetical protein
MARGLPFPAFWLGLGGLIPVGACAAGAFIGPHTWRGLALTALIGYGAVILAFLGAVHWGLALAATAEAETRHVRTRLTLGVVPALIGWGAPRRLDLPSPPRLRGRGLGEGAGAARAEPGQTTVARLPTLTGPPTRLAAMGTRRTLSRRGGRGSRTQLGPAGPA